MIMPDHPWRRAMLLLLLGMGVFFVIAATISFLIWITAGDWRPFLDEIAAIAVFLTIPGVYHLWGRYVVQHL